MSLQLIILLFTSLDPASSTSFLFLAFLTNGFPPSLINVAPLLFIKRAAIFLSSHPTQADHLLPCTPCISSFPLKLMKKKSAATHQWRRPDYPDQGVCVHTNCTVMESLSYHPLFGYNILKVFYNDKGAYFNICTIYIYYANVCIFFI